MVRLFHKSEKRPASAPGTLHFIGRRKVDNVRLTLIDYDQDHLDERDLAGVEECLPFRDLASTSWINLYGLHDVEVLKRIGDHYGLHPLVQEDILNTSQRPKLEDFGGYLFLTCSMVRWDAAANGVEYEQISLVILRGVVLTFQERPGDVFGEVRERLRRGRGRIRGAGAGYLGYALLDAIVDHHFSVLEHLGEAIDALEDELLLTPDITHLQRVHALKREMLMLRRSVWPLREMVSGLLRAESDLIGEETEPFLRDVHDHVIQVADAVETFRDMLSGLQDLYLSSVSNRLNDVMKVLTIFASIFVPLTFVAGIYGMNFEHMPELAWKWGYPFFWCIAIGIGGGLVLFFRRKGWL